MQVGKFGTLSELAIEVERQYNVQKDFIANTENMTVYAPNEEEGFKVNVGVENQGVHKLLLDDLALQQMATKSEIPRSYQKSLIARGEEALFAHNINTLQSAHPHNRMIRTLDGHARSFMSDKYKRIDNMPVLSTILPVLHEKGGDLKIESCDITANKMYLKIVSPKLQGEVKQGDVVQAGMIISNSEVGLGSWRMQQLLYTLACTNGMISGKEVGGIDQRHVGARQHEGIMFREDTVYADQQAFALKVRDTMDQLLDEGNFQRQLERLRETTTRSMAKQADPTKVVIELGKEVGYTQTEGSAIMQHLIQGGDLSQYGLANAVTRYAQDDEVSYDRSTQLEAIGGKVIDLTGRKLERILEAA
jgi:hypothetical protein